jgi:hypothetical protein
MSLPAANQAECQAECPQAVCLIWILIKVLELCLVAQLASFSIYNSRKYKKIRNL